MNGPLLVILPHNPGDVVMGLLALRRVREEFPDLAIDFVVGEECRELAEGHPLLRRAHVLPRRELVRAWESGDAQGVVDRLQGFLDGLAETRYGLSLNLFQERFGALIQALVGAEAKAGLELHELRFRVAGRGNRGSRFLEHLFAIPAARAQNGWHAVDLYIRAAREAMGRAPAATGGPRAWESGAPWNPAAGTPLPRGPYLAFHPGSAWPGKRWPETHWAALAQACLRAGVEVALTGSPEEVPLAGRILSRLPSTSGIHDFTGKTSLTQSARVLAGADRVVTGDTVAMHLAAACGAPTLCLFGASNPVETGPYGKGHFILQTDLEPAADLALDREHAGLAALRPEAVAGLLLQGTAPAGVDLWQTAWDPDQDMQVLRDRRQALHPHQRAAARLMRTLDRPPSDSASPPPDLDGARAGMLRLLDLCLRDPGAYARALEEAERAWAETTGRSLIWEAYRIGINGVALRSIRDHLEQRRSRFLRALREERAAADGAPAPIAG